MRPRLPVSSSPSGFVFSPTAPPTRQGPNVPIVEGPNVPIVEGQHVPIVKCPRTQHGRDGYFIRNCFQASTTTSSTTLPVADPRIRDPLTSSTTLPKYHVEVPFVK